MDYNTNNGFVQGFGDIFYNSFDKLSVLLPERDGIFLIMTSVHFKKMRYNDV